MNKNTFKSAYSKLALSEESRNSIRARLMEQMSLESGAERSDEDDGSHRAQEIKLTPKKRSPLKTALIAGSAAAAVAVCAVGAGFWLNSKPMTQQNETPTAEVQSSEEATEEVTKPETDEAYIEDEYYSKRCANGILHFQEFTETTEEYSRPMNPVEETFRQYLTEKYPFIRSRRLGMDNEYSERIEDDRAAIELLEGAEAAQAHVDEMVAYLPLGDELWLSEGRTSDTGIAMVYRSENDTKQVNFSVSDRPDEFYPITLPEGGYLTPVGEYRSSFTMGTVTQFIDPEMFQLAAGSVTVGNDEYFTAVFAYNVTDFGMKYFRIDGKNITQEQFVNCIGTVSYAMVKDHVGYYKDDGLNNYNIEEGETENTIAPDPEDVNTEWGILKMNALANKYPAWNGNYAFNVQYNSEKDLPDEYRYNISDIAEYSGIDIQAALPDRFSTQRISYQAKYDEIPSVWNGGKGYGVNGEMLPGDDPQEFEDSRAYIEGVYDDGEGETVYDSARYITDKIPYFNDKTRIGAMYYLTCTSDDENEKLEILCFDDWDIAHWYIAGLFARLPATKTYGFAGVNDRYLYFAGDVLCGNENYIAGFTTDDGRYVVLQTCNTGLQTFAETLAKLFTNDPSPAKLCEAEYPPRAFALGLPDLIYETATGQYEAGDVELHDYTPSSDTVYFTTAHEALAAAEKLGGKGASVLAEEWTLIPEKSGVTRYENGEPAELAIYFTNGDKELLVGMSTMCYMDTDTELRMPLPDGRKMDKVPGYYVYECTMFRKEALDNMLYMDPEMAYKAGICGRMVNETEYFHAETDGTPGIAYMIDSKGLSAEEAIDALAVMAYQQENPEFIGKYDGSNQPFHGSFGYALWHKFDCGVVNVNELSFYGKPQFDSDSGEQETTAAEAQRFLEENSITVELPFQPETVTRRSCATNEGYTSEAVTYRSGDKSVRLNVIENGASMYAYGEQYGVGRLEPDVCIMSSYQRDITLCHPVVSAGTLAYGKEICFGIFSDSATGTFYTVTTENVSLEEFSDVLGQVYLLDRTE